MQPCIPMCAAACKGIQTFSTGRNICYFQIYIMNANFWQPIICIYEQSSQLQCSVLSPNLFEYGRSERMLRGTVWVVQRRSKDFGSANQGNMKETISARGAERSWSCRGPVDALHHLVWNFWLLLWFNINSKFSIQHFGFTYKGGKNIPLEKS